MRASIARIAAETITFAPAAAKNAQAINAGRPPPTVPAMKPANAAPASAEQITLITADLRDSDRDIVIVKIAPTMPQTSA